MITPNIIKAQLFQFLPIYTDRFSNIVDAESAVVQAGDVVNIEKTAHGLLTGSAIVVTLGQSINGISNPVFSSADQTVTFTTAFTHDLTSVGRDGKVFDYNTATLSGFADSNFNGDFPVLSIPSNTEFVISATAMPTGDLGDLLESRDLYITPATVTTIDADNFTIPNIDTQVPSGAMFNSFKYVDSSRIYVAATQERAKAMYTNHTTGEDVLFIVMRPESASKDRHAYSDAIATAKAQNPVRLKYLPEVDLFVFIPTPDDVSGAKAQDIAYREIRTAIRKAMYAHVFFEDDTVDIQYAAVEATNSPEEWNTAVYVHSYSYQLPYEITFEHGDTFRTSVSARNILIKSKMFDNDGALVGANVILEP